MSRLCCHNNSPNWYYTDGTGPDRIMGLHSLRHRFNTQLRDLGLGYEDRRALLGHKAASRITADYTHGNVDFLKSYTDQL